MMNFTTQLIYSTSRHH